MALLLLGALACAHRPAEPSDPVPAPLVIPGASVTFYDLQGATPVDVVESLVAAAPQDTDIRHAAQTRWEVVWRYPAGPDDQPEACDLSTVDVHVDVVTAFPRWEPPAEAAPADVAEWRRYTAALAGHEVEHVARITELAGTLPAVLGASDCAHADAEGQRVLDAIRASNVELDVQTRDGATEGAALAWIDARADG